MNLFPMFQFPKRVWTSRISFLLAGLGCWLLAFPSGAATNLVAALPPDMLAYHLATNAVGRAQQFNGSREDMVELHAPLSLELNRFFEPAWSHNFWLKGVQGLSATCIGFRNCNNGQGLVTLVSPRHYLCATHMHPEGRDIAFLDTLNRLHWRKTLQRLDVTNDTSVGLLDADLPPGVGFLPVLPDDYTNYLPTTPASIVQGIGMNQDMCLFSQPLTLAYPDYVVWDSQRPVPSGLGTNWNVTIRGGDSSSPALLLVGNQLVLVSHNFTANSGPNYAHQIPAINRAMHQLSASNHLRSDYQLTPFPLTNWPVCH